MTDQVNPNVIYTITALRVKDKTNYKTRVWGWQPTFQEASRSVLQNYGDMFEHGYYQLAVIEKVKAGSLAIMEREWWYKATFNNNKAKVKKIKKPKQFENLVHFSMG